MALYAIGDTHLSLSSDKPMDVFGGGWTGYVEKLREGLSVLEPGGHRGALRGSVLGHEPGGGEAGLCFPQFLPGAEAAFEGEP